MKVKQISEQYETRWLEGLPIKGIIAMEDNEVRFINGIVREVKQIYFVKTILHFLL